MTRDEARRRAEEALAKTALLGPIAPASSTWVSVRADDLAALLAAEPEGKACGSISAVRSDATPAQPLPTCANCGSNLIAPAPSPARDEVREAAERTRDSMHAWISAHSREHANEFVSSVRWLLSALAAKGGA